MNTHTECLRAAIDGEIAASEKYDAFALRASEEDLLNVAALFRALAAGERVHIRNHRRALGESEATMAPTTPSLGTTLENLREAIRGEMHETQTMYPEMIRVVRNDRSEAAKVTRLSLEWAGKVEKRHAELLRHAEKHVSRNQDIADSRAVFCRVCGNVELIRPKGPCAVCGHDAGFFEEAR